MNKNIINTALMLAVISVAMASPIAEAKGRSSGSSSRSSSWGSKPSGGGWFSSNKATNPTPAPAPVYRSVAPVAPKPQIVKPAMSGSVAPTAIGSKPQVQMQKVSPVKPTSPNAANVAPNGKVPQGPTVAGQNAKKNGFQVNTTKPVSGFKPSKPAQLTPPTSYPKTLKAPPRSVKNYYYQPTYGYISQPYYHKRSDGTMWKIAAGMALGALAYSAFADDTSMNVASDLNNLNSEAVSQKVYCVTQEGDQSKILSMANLQAAKTIFDSNNVPMNCYNTQAEFAGNFR